MLDWVSHVPLIMHPQDPHHRCINESSTSHITNPIPEDPSMKYETSEVATTHSASSDESSLSLEYTSSSDYESPGTPATDPQLADVAVEATAQ